MTKLVCSRCRRRVVARPPVGWPPGRPRPVYSHEDGSELCRGGEPMVVKR